MGSSDALLPFYIWRHVVPINLILKFNKMDNNNLLIANNQLLTTYLFINFLIQLKIITNFNQFYPLLSIIRFINRTRPV